VAAMKFCWRCSLIRLTGFVCRRFSVSFSILITFARQHVFSYNRVYDLIEKAEKDWRYKMIEKSTGLPELFDG